MTNTNKAREYPEYTSKFPELAFYAFPGSTSETRAELEQVKFAEQLGIGNVMISERADYKEAMALCGAVAAVTENIYIGTSATNANTRHPIFMAAGCSTINRLSLGRFALGLGKGVPSMQKAFGLKQITYAREREYIDVIRRLLKGEKIADYSGLIGDYPMLTLMTEVNEDIPVMFIGFGPKSLKHAGTLYDGVHLHTFLTPQTVYRAVKLVREGERDASREQGKTKVWTVLATVVNPTEKEYLKKVVARHASYLATPGAEAYGNGLARISGWEKQKLERFRHDPAVTAVDGIIDTVATYSQLEAIDKALPQEWRSAAIGTPAECAKRWVEEFEAGADGVIIHACTPEEFEPVLTEYEKIRPNHLFENRTNRPA